MSILQLVREGQPWVQNDLLIFTDPPEAKQVDAVFPLCHENRYFLENLQVPENGLVLEVCSGSGVLAIQASRIAKKVIGIDINFRAIKYANINAKLNSLSEKVKFIHGNLFNPVKGNIFDLIIANPPFEPTPPNELNFLHSDGGVRGSLILRKIVEEAPNYLNPEGSLQLITYLAEGELGILEELKNNFQIINVTEISVIDGNKFRDSQISRLPICPEMNKTLSENEFHDRLCYIFVEGKNPKPPQKDKISA